jgi:hypothetical protein
VRWPLPSSFYGVFIPADPYSAASSLFGSSLELIFAYAAVSIFAPAAATAAITAPAFVLLSIVVH